jgi:predicted secreted hydrolase
VRDLWMAHIALSDINGQRFYHEERLNRSGPGVAGVDAQTGLVWNGNWQAHIAEHREELRGVTDRFGLALKLDAREAARDPGPERGEPEGRGRRACFALLFADTPHDLRIH